MILKINSTRGHTGSLLVDITLLRKETCAQNRYATRAKRGRQLFSARNWRSQIPDHRRFVQNWETRQRETRRSGSAPKRNAPKWKRAKEKRAELESRQNESRQSETRQTNARQSKTRQCGMTPLSSTRCHR